MRKIFLFSIVALATVFISSCEKDEIVKEDLSTNETTEVSTLKSGYATGLYGVNQNYKNAYYHLQQNTNDYWWNRQLWQCCAQHHFHSSHRILFPLSIP